MHQITLSEYHEVALKICSETERCLSPAPSTIALFGSFASYSLKDDSDIDLLLVSNKLPNRPYDRAKWIRPLLESWTALQRSHFIDFPKSLSTLSISKKSFTESLGLRLSLSNTTWILRDDGFFSGSLNEAAGWILDGTWRRKPLKHGGWAWIPNKGVA